MAHRVRFPATSAFPHAASGRRHEGNRPTVIFRSMLQYAKYRSRLRAPAAGETEPGQGFDRPPDSNSPSRRPHRRPGLPAAISLERTRRDGPSSAGLPILRLALRPSGLKLYLAAIDALSIQITNWSLFFVGVNRLEASEFNP